MKTYHVQNGTDYGNKTIPETSLTGTRPIISIPAISGTVGRHNVPEAYLKQINY